MAVELAKLLSGRASTFWNRLTAACGELRIGGIAARVDVRDPDAFNIERAGTGGRCTRA
jgi:hypothetical protein